MLTFVTGWWQQYITADVPWMVTCLDDVIPQSSRHAVLERNAAVSAFDESRAVGVVLVVTISVQGADT